MRRIVLRRAPVFVLAVFVACCGSAFEVSVLCGLFGPPPAASATSVASAAEASSSPAYRPPVDAPLVDVFRPPPTPYGSGNRGIDYAADPGTAVRAAGDGVVTFAGSVGGSRHVVVLHGDGIRTSYSFLAATTVQRGQMVQQGQTVGTVGPAPLHFGARAGDTYLDPTGLFLRPRSRARLLPDDGRGLPPEGPERGALVRLVAALGRTAVHVAGTAVSRMPPPGLDLTSAAVLALVRHQFERTPCTPQSVPPPVPSTRRRLAVLVGGLGSSSGHAAILDVPTDALGYRRSDTVQFSYRGGTAAEHRYGPVDTQLDPAEAGRRLRTLLDRLAAANPGVPIDVFAHSQGGLVARAALTAAPPTASPAPTASRASTTAGTSPPPVAHLITYGTPHDGADLAEGFSVVTRTIGGGAIARASSAAGARPLGLDPARPSIGALAPGSSFVRNLNRSSPPSGVRITSIAARRDMVVPAPRSWLPGATNVVVAGHGINAHAQVPGSKEAVRETALALADRPPTCESALDAALDAAAATAVQLGERAAVGVVRHGAPPMLGPGLPPSP